MIDTLGLPDPGASPTREGAGVDRGSSPVTVNGSAGSAAVVTGGVVSIRYDADVVVGPVAVDQMRLRDFTGSVPWRRFRSHRGQRHLPGKYWSATTGAHVPFESQLELARLLLADFDPGVSWIWAQPARLEARVDGRRRWHVPDFLLAAPAGEAMVVNVKPATRVGDPKIVAALAWPGELLSGHGWRYEVWSGTDPVVLENVRFLAAYRRPGLVCADLIDRASEQVEDGEQFAAAEARLAGTAPGWTVRPGLLALLWRHCLVTDLSRPLSGSSILRRPRERTSASPADPDLSVADPGRDRAGPAATAVSVGQAPVGSVAER